ncbi:MAG: hypothetical protein NTZ17_00445 [Phycisphaerae bacterium]|nr:hypothetical protein [Phycisphaerae bacterium]
MEITSDIQLRQAQKLAFCYLCGRGFEVKEHVTRDHVPPKAVFLPCDRTKPLILPTHDNCNQRESRGDEVVGQLIGALYGVYPRMERRRVKIGVYENAVNKTPVLALEGISLTGVIARCIKGFHAALYGEYLPKTTPHWFDPPTAVGSKKGNQIVFEETRPHFLLFVRTIKKNRKAGRVDRISCFNDKCVYECVWERTDGGTWACFFALNIYDWKELGDASHQPRRGCVGFYMPTRGRPPQAMIGITRVLEIPIPNAEAFDPFGN